MFGLSSPERRNRAGVWNEPHGGDDGAGSDRELRAVSPAASTPRAAPLSIVTRGRAPV